MRFPVGGTNCGALGWSFFAIPLFSIPLFSIRCGLFVAAGQHGVLLYNGFVAEEVFAEAVEVDSAADGCGAVHGEDVVGMLLDALQAGPVALLAHGVVEAVGDGGIAGYAAVAILVEAVPISRLTVTSSKKRRRGCAASGSCGTAPGGVGLR